MTHRFAFSLLFVCSVSAAPKDTVPGLRLPDAVRPVRNAAELTITPGADSFQGHIDIDLDVREPREIVWVNATELKVASATINGAPAQVVPGSKSVIGFQPAKPLAPGAAKLSVDYSGRISKSSSAGVFELREGDDWYVYTQFEPTDARRAFPCFDEPSFKAPWQITLRVPEKIGAFSNTPEAASKPDGSGMKRVEFKSTRPLPSYLVAFAAGPFDVLDAGRSAKRHVPLRILAPKGHAKEAEFARTAIPELLGLLEKYFDTPYPYEKLDSVVMPISNFAMENAGLITYGQSMLLARPDGDTMNRRRLCALVLAHEMAHQWFGDLVTTAWWNDIWLNEAFATWAENKITNEWRPDWDIDIGRVQDRLGAMNLDSLVTTRRIRQPIESEGDIANAFDGITYEKGAAVILMFERWIGEQKFRKGVQLYLKRHADGNATAGDFLAALSSAAGRDIAPSFFTFLDQPGVPAIGAELQCDRSGARLELTQKRSLPVGSAGGSNERWTIPVCVGFESGGETRHACQVITEPAAEMKLPGKACPAWVLPNDGENGYYRVAYRGDLLERLLKNGRGELSAAEKVGVLGDVRALVQAGDIPADRALAIVPEFSNEQEPDVVSQALDIINIVPDSETPDELEPRRAAFIRSVFGARAERLGWSPKERESDNDWLLRQDLVPFVANSGEDETLIAEARKLARTWLADRKGIDANMLGPALRTAAQNGDAELFDAMLAAAKSSKDPHERETLIQALGSFHDPALVRRAMDLVTANVFDIRESFHALLLGPVRNRGTETLPFEFVRDHLTQLMSVLPREVGGDFAASLVNVGEGFCSTEGAAEVDGYFEPKAKEWTGGDRRLANVLEIIRLCAARRAAILPSYARGLSVEREAAGSQ